MLALQVGAYGVGFLWAYVVHNEGAVSPAQLFGFGRQGVVDGMRPHDRVVLETGVRVQFSV